MERTQSTMVEQIRKEAYQEARPKPIDELLTSGAMVYNLALGGGYAWGRIINLVGDKSTGKTLLAAEVIVAAHNELALKGKTLKWIYDDAEAGFTFDTKAMYGIDILQDVEPSETIEDFKDHFKDALQSLKKNQYLIYVLDSLDSIMSSEERKRAEKGMEEGSYNLEKQKKLGQFFREMRQKIRHKKVLLIIISQIRQNIGVSFGEKYRRTGGMALDFYAAQIIWLSEVDKTSVGELVTGITVKAKVKKNKIGKPYRSAFINILFDYGIDDIASSIDYLYDLRDKRGKIKKDRGSRKLKWNGKEYSRKRLIQHIEQKNLEEKLSQKVVVKWMQVEADAAPQRKRRYPQY